MSLAEWPSHKGDATFAGPYGGLPTLTWDGLLVAETLPIASFVARRLGHHRNLGDDAIARFGGASPVVADFFAAEAFELMSYLVGPDRLPTLRAKLPKLTTLAARVRELPALAREWERRPPQFTARADEHCRSDRQSSRRSRRTGAACASRHRRAAAPGTIHPYRGRASGCW